MQRPHRDNNSNKVLFQYAGLGAQILVALGLAVFIGVKADEKLHFSFPLLVWLLPLLVLIGMIYKIIRDTSKKNESK